MFIHTSFCCLVTKLRPPLCDPMDDIASQAPLSRELSRQEYWSGLPCAPPGDLPDPGTEAPSLLSPALAGRFFTSRATWEAMNLHALSHSVMTDFCDHGLQPARLLCPWDSPGKNTGVGSHFPSPGDLPNPEIEPRSPAIAGGFFTD